jgi:hypothetical protein
LLLPFTRLRLLLRTTRLLLLLAALIVLLLLALSAVARSLLLLLLLPSIALLRPRTFAIAALFAARGGFPGARFPLAHLLLHEPALLRILLRARLVESAVGAALPTFRVCFPAVRTGDALRQRHRKLSAVYPERSEGSADAPRRSRASALRRASLHLRRAARIVHFAPCSTTRVARRCSR